MAVTASSSAFRLFANLMAETKARCDSGDSLYANDDFRNNGPPR